MKEYASAYEKYANAGKDSHGTSGSQPAGTALLAKTDSSSADDDYSKYYSANQHGGPSSGSSAGGSPASKYMKEYASADEKYANAGKDSHGTSGGQYAGTALLSSGHSFRSLLAAW